MFKNTVLTFLIFASMVVKAGPFSALDTALKSKDFLAARIIVKKMGSSDLNFVQWWTVRKVIHRYPQIGWSLLTAWDSRYMKKFSDKLSPLDKKIVEADDLMLANKFEEAFANYQYVLQASKGKDSGGMLFTNQLYHRMGRALYGAGRYVDALTVYDWIGNDYIFLRQILFEKTWAAFRANRIERAMGLITSQYSIRFQLAMEPEIPLLQFYIYKRLCRNEEAKKVIERVQKLLDSYKTQVTWEDWAKSDIENLWTFRLLDKKDDLTNVVSAAERKNEQELIKKNLRAQFEYEKARLLDQGTRVVAYMNLAVDQNPKELLQIAKLPSKDKLLHSSLNIWTAEDAEEWSDEVGLHYFIGDSLCGKK